MTISITEMTFNDRIRLAQLRNDRLRSFFAEDLLGCVFYRSCHKVLKIHCSEAWTVDVLLPELEELRDYAWLILGVEAIALYYAQEEICRTKHLRVHRAIYKD